jgi:predicted kinase
VKLIVLRGLPGSGKSTLAREFHREQGGLVLASDDYFLVGGHYTWDSAALGLAHRWNQWRCRIAMERKLPLIVIDNTHTLAHEAKPYVELSVKHGYEVEFLEVDTPWAKDAVELTKRCQHAIPQEKIELMIERWEEYTVKSVLKAKAPWEEERVYPSKMKCHLGFHDWGTWGYPRYKFQHRRCFRCGKEVRRLV